MFARSPKDSAKWPRRERLLVEPRLQLLQQLLDGDGGGVSVAAAFAREPGEVGQLIASCIETVSPRRQRRITFLLVDEVAAARVKPIEDLVFETAERRIVSVNGRQAAGLTVQIDVPPRNIPCYPTHY
jgi:hypothetical protein